MGWFLKYFFSNFKIHEDQNVFTELADDMKESECASNCETETHEENDAIFMNTKTI